MEIDKDKLSAMLAVVEDCVKNDKLEFLASILYKLQIEYNEICELSTDGEFQPSWTHKQVLDHLTFNQKY